jgi:hypothetical protein
MWGTSMIGAAVLAISFGLVPCFPAAAITNPHYTEHCPSCHLKLPEKGSDGEMDYNFLAEDIDPTCMICHSDECCTIAKPNQFTHASGIDRWDEDKYGTPQVLPLFDGYITCVTCHFWRRSNNPAPVDYKLVRLVEITPTGVRWTVLCQDCHRDY